MEGAILKYDKASNDLYVTTAAPDWCQMSNFLKNWLTRTFSCEEQLF